MNLIGKSINQINKYSEFHFTPLPHVPGENWQLFIIEGTKYLISISYKTDFNYCLKFLDIQMNNFTVEIVAADEFTLAGKILGTVESIDFVKVHLKCQNVIL